jgi:hypothetical protein
MAELQADDRQQDGAEAVAVWAVWIEELA